MSLQTFTLTNQQGIQVTVLNYGGAITSILAPDKDGNMDDIVLGMEKPEEYQQQSAFLGALIGRYGNRIAKGKFTLNGKSYSLATNNGPNHLHGGNKGFDKVMWDVVHHHAENKLTLTYTSPDGEEGYPGNLDVTVNYALTEDNELVITYTASSDQPTPVNLTNHSYFNLAGKQADTILEHEISLRGNYFIPVDQGGIPTGEIRPVAGTAMDFTEARKISSEIEQVSGGYDHTYVLRKDQPRSLSPAASVYEPKTGRTLKMLTTEPGVQFYTGNFLDGSITGRGGRVYHKHAGFCLEAQHYPDSPNHPKFPNTILGPEETYRQVTIYKFGVR